MTTGNVVIFPGSGPVAPVNVTRELAEIELDRLVDAVEASAAATLDCGVALRWLRSGNPLSSDNHVLTGETLYSLLSASLAVSLLMGSRNSERALQREIYSWIEKERGDEPEG